MKATELRIGNWITDPQNRPMKVNEIDFDESYESGFVNKFTLSKCTTLQITEEWLLKCGFSEIKKVAYSNGIGEEYFIYLKDDLLYNTIQDQWWYDKIQLKNIKYIHQLQNLYFALTGEELTLK